MNKKKQPMQKGLTILFVWGFILCSAFPGSTAEKKHKNEPSQLQVDTLKLETIAFSLAPLLVFTLTNKTLYTPNQYFSRLQKKRRNHPPNPHGSA